MVRFYHSLIKNPKSIFLKFISVGLYKRFQIKSYFDFSAGQIFEASLSQ